MCPVGLVRPAKAFRRVAHYGAGCDTEAVHGGGQKLWSHNGAGFVAVVWNPAEADACALHYEGAGN